MKEKTCGVIIGRFQVHSLHDGHKFLIDSVKEKHKKIIILIGSTPGILVTRSNPLDFYTRKLMIQSEYPDVIVLPLNDMPVDEAWSDVIDSKIAETLGDHVDSVIYGSRDSFIPSYKGRFETVELEQSGRISGTKMRSDISDDVRSSEEFRRGVIYAAFNKHSTAFCTVDIVIVNQEKKQVLLGRKSSDPKRKWRFVGGFIDPSKDESIEMAARRESREETGGSLSLEDYAFIGSTVVDDWRYRRESDKIITSVFSCKYVYGHAKASDDIFDLQWFDDNEGLVNFVVDQHIPILNIYLDNKYMKET